MAKNNRNYKLTTTSEINYSKVIKIGIVVLLILGLVYFFTALSMGEIKLKKTKKEEVKTEIQYDEIIAGESFNRSDKEYYVLYFNFTDKFASYYLSLIDSYKTKEDSKNIYIVDLEKKINSYIVGESVIKSNNINELKVINPTLIKVNNKQVESIISSRDEILKFFK